MTDSTLLAMSQDFTEFLEASPSPYHCVAEVKRVLDENCFIELNEQDPWEEIPPGAYVVRDGSLIAYSHGGGVDTSSDAAMRILVAHTDSPGFKLKPHQTHVSHGWKQLSMEVYGSPLLTTWFDREIGLAGQVIGHDLQKRLVLTGALGVIPSLAPHFESSSGQPAVMDRQKHLMAVYGTHQTGSKPESLLAYFNDVGSTVAGHDLYTFPIDPPRLFGDEDQFLAARGLDDLSSVYPGLRAFLRTDPQGSDMTMVAFVDHEEVGSQTYSGAGGTFLAQTVERLLRGLGLGEDKISQIKANSIMISADAGHGIHPNYPDKHDPDAQPMVGGGPLIKVNAQHRYSTDGWGLALWDGLCRKAGVEYQIFVSNNSVRCGTTIGPILAAGIGVSALDVGVPILAMHSARELCAPSDVDELRRVFEVFFSGGPR